MTLAKEQFRPLNRIREGVINLLHVVGFLVIVAGFLLLAGLIVLGIFLGVSFAAQALGITDLAASNW